jgi:hypothetical protein
MDLWFCKYHYKYWANSDPGMKALVEKLLEKIRGLEKDLEKSRNTVLEEVLSEFRPQYESYYPEKKKDVSLPPFARDSDTSREAAIKMHMEAPTLRARIYRMMNANTLEGLTCDEVERHLGLRHQTASPRVWELRRLGLIKDSGRRRKTRSGRNAVVWKTVKGV